MPLATLKSFFRNKTGLLPKEKSKIPFINWRRTLTRREYSKSSPHQRISKLMVHMLAASETIRLVHYHLSQSSALTACILKREKKRRNNIREIDATIINNLREIMELANSGNLLPLQLTLLYLTWAWMIQGRYLRNTSILRWHPESVTSPMRPHTFPFSSNSFQLQVIRFLHMKRMLILYCPRDKRSPVSLYG